MSVINVIAEMLVLILLIIMSMVFSSSASTSLWRGDQCVSFRYIEREHCDVAGVLLGNATISEDESLVTFSGFDRCIAYRFIPCRDGWKTWYPVYDNSSSKQVSECENATVMDTINHHLHHRRQMEKMGNDFNREKKSWLDYMVSVWDERTIDENAEKAKAIQDRMQDYIRYSVARLGLRELVDVPKLRADFGTVYNDILTIPYPINIPACPKNGTSTSSDVPSLFVAVTGVATDNNQKKRDDIRAIFKKEITTLKPNLFSSINFGFFLGKPGDSGNQSPIQQESDKNKDVVQMDIIDSGRNGSLKLAAIFNWVRLYCDKVDVIFMINENYEKVTLKKLGSTLTEKYIPNTFVYGVRGQTNPYDQGGEVWGRRRITKEEFPWKTFPSYFNGLAYFITGNMIVPLMAAFQTVPMIPLEDVYLGICIIKADMKRYTYCGSDINSNYCF